MATLPGLSRQIVVESAVIGRLLSPVLPAPVPGHLERAGPDAATGSACLVFLGHIGPRISAVGDGPAVSHLLRSEIGAAGETPGDQAAVAVDIAFEAPNGPPADQRCQGMRGGLPAVPVLSLGGPAQLPSFGGIDPVDADTELADADAVSVGNRRDARDFVRSGQGAAGGENGQDCGENRDQAHLVHRRVPSWAV